MKLSNRLLKQLCLILLRAPYFNRFSRFFYKKLGVLGKEFRFSPKVTVVGEYNKIILGQNSEINEGCFILCKELFELGENSTLAYQTTILTSANPNTPYNGLGVVYPKIEKPVKIGDNTWIGARAIILPGVTVGNYCVVAAGSVVTKDVLDYSVVAGVPARVIKELNKDIFTK